MRTRSIAAFGLGMVILVGVVGAAKADPKDYRFEAVQTQVAATVSTTIAVRLVRVSDGTPVVGAILFQPKLEMPMDGMAPMPTQVLPATPDGKGTYPFTADLSMAGPWVLKVSAKVQGEALTISGAVPFTAGPATHAH